MWKARPAFGWLVVVTLIAGCATTKTPSVATPSSTSVGEGWAELIRRGCYRCLEQALADAEARARAGARGAAAQAFEAAALLVLRSKELGLPTEPWLGRARTLAGADVTLAPYLRLVEAIPPHPMSDDRDALFDVRARTQARTSLAAWRETLQGGPAETEEGHPTKVFRMYLDVALVCGFGTLKQNDESFAGQLDADARAPVYQYRIGICDSAHAERLKMVRAADAEFVDADFALGRYAIDDPISPDQDEALRRLESARTAFPRSPAIAVTLGNVYRRWEEWSDALAIYDAALAGSPRHPEALIGRVISLSHLVRPHEAIESATQVIDAGQWYLGEAYYWRGWNQLRLGQHDLARADADRAKTLMANAAVFVLSGVIEWRLRRLETAEREFESAIAIDFGECEAALDLGVVRDERRKPAEALAAFQQARQCYDLSIALRREAIARVQAGPGTETSKARDAARHRRELTELETRRDEALRAIAVLDAGKSVP
jgi:tetratricopeptide (TPR) repeat protein